METKKVFELPEGITQGMIDEAIKEYGGDKVKFADLPLNEEGSQNKTVLVVVPSRTVVGQYQKWESADPKKAQEILVKACLKSHKIEVLADDGLFYGALNAIAELIPVRKGIIKNI